MIGESEMQLIQPGCLDSQYYNQQFQNFSIDLTRKVSNCQFFLLRWLKPKSLDLSTKIVTLAQS